jgi:hypothetical protein
MWDPTVARGITPKVSFTKCQLLKKENWRSAEPGRKPPSTTVTDEQ